MIVINADDFGLNEHNAKAIIEAFKEGKITNTTMMSTGEYFDEAIVLAKENDLLDKIGVHFNLDEGKPLTENIKKVNSICKNGEFILGFNRKKRFNKSEKQAIYEELCAQIDRIENAGIVVKRADSHHHIHNVSSIVKIVLRVCKEHNVNIIRIHRNIGKIAFYKKPGKMIYNWYLRKKGFKTSKYFGSMEDVELCGLKDNLEIMVHPDFNKDGILIDRIDEQGGFPVGKPLVNLLKGNS